MLTDAETATFVAWLDAGVAAAEAAELECVKSSDPAAAVKHRIEALALRIVAVKLRAAQVIVETPQKQGD